MQNIDLELIKIYNTSNYGLIKENIIYYDDQRILNEYLLNFKLYRIRCWTIANVGISGLEVYYKDRITSKEVKTIDAKRKELCDEEEQELTLDSNEMINEVILWKNDPVLGFKVKTNKGREQKFGICGEGTKIELDELNGNNYICGLFCGYHKKDGVISLGFYYINERNFYLLLYYGIICLRIKLRKEEFKKKIDEKVNQMSYADKALYKACTLPNNQFHEIFKYIFV